MLEEMSKPFMFGMSMEAEVGLSCFIGGVSGIDTSLSVGVF